MSASPASGGGRIRAFRLSEVPLPIRQRHANSLIRKAANPVEAMKIGLVIQQPTDRMYAVSLTAWERVMGR